MNINKIKKAAKTILAVPVIRKSLRIYNLCLYRFLSLSKIFAIPYHLIFSRSFDREIFAYTNAIHEYNRKTLNVYGSNIVIRRNIHRLEKGLIMENRRPIFALDYIEETVETYTAILQKSNEIDLEVGEIQWAHDVLADYFKSVDASHALIRRLKEKFETLPEPHTLQSTTRFIPYQSGKRSELQIPTYEAFLNLSTRRRSVRWFKDQKVPREAVDMAIQAAIQAPSACNRQSFHYRIFDDPQLTREIANIPFGTSGYADQLPMVVVIIGDLSNYFSSRDRHIIYIDAALSAMAFMYALETVGLSSVTINWPDFGLLESRMKRALHLKTYERPVLLLGVGYAKDEGKVPFSQKKPLEKMRSYNDLGVTS